MPKSSTQEKKKKVQGTVAEAALASPRGVLRDVETPLDSLQGVLLDAAAEDFAPLFQIQMNTDLSATTRALFFSRALSTEPKCRGVRRSSARELR